MAGPSREMGKGRLVAPTQAQPFLQGWLSAEWGGLVVGGCPPEGLYGASGIPVYILHCQSSIPDDKSPAFCAAPTVCKTLSSKEKRQRGSVETNILNLFKSLCVCVCARVHV